MALSAASAAVVFLWRRQDRAEAKLLRAEEHGTRVHVSWATVEDEKGHARWGILVTNQLHAEISDLEVACSGNTYAQGRFWVDKVPPGKFFFESLKGIGRAWGFSESEPKKVNYINSRRTHTIDTIRFTYAGHRYTRNPDGSIHEDLVEG